MAGVRVKVRVMADLGLGLELWYRLHRAIRNLFRLGLGMVVAVAVVMGGIGGVLRLEVISSSMLF